jgi:hypothetical protein
MKLRTLPLALILLTIITLGAFPGLALGRAVPAGDLSADSSNMQAVSTPVRIRFDRGATSAVVSGTLTANSSIRYVLGARAGQLLDVQLSPPEGARLSVTTTSGRALTPSIGSSSTGFRGYLPRSGDYWIEVKAGSQAVSYSLNITIPIRVSFEAGATSATLAGGLAAHRGLDYILRARAGQLLEIEILPANSVQLIIYGADGTVLRSGMGEGSSFRGELPSSQDYLVSVRAGSKEVSYSMRVAIPRRVSFQRGTISGTEYGRLSAGNSQYYVLRALKNQTMQVEITPAEGMQLVIYGADGSVLKSGRGEGANFKGQLPSTQDYVLVVTAGTQPVRYTLRVTIP